MNTNYKNSQQIIKDIENAIIAEISHRYEDTSFFGGFSNYLAKRAEDLVASLPESYDLVLDKLQIMIHNYLKVNQSERRIIIDKMNDILRRLVQEFNKDTKDYMEKEIIDWNKPFIVTKVLADEKEIVNERLEKEIIDNRLTRDFEVNNYKFENSNLNISTDKKNKNFKAESKKIIDKSPKYNNLQNGLQFLSGVGSKRVKLLNKLGVFNIKDLLFYFPKRYEDRSNLKKIHQLINGEIETVQGRVITLQELKPRRGLNILKVAIDDGTGVLYGVWFNQSYLKNQVKAGTEIIISGKVEKKFNNVQIAVSDFETIDGSDTTHTGRIVPIYSLTEGVNNRFLRNIIKKLIDESEEISLAEFLPDEIIKKFKLPLINEAVKNIHFPENMRDLERARKRFIFEELFLLQIGILMLKSTQTTESVGIPHSSEGKLIQSFLDILPFKLTNAQKEVWVEINRDMEANKSMNRLVQGDVGSGKTVVATLALIKTVENGYQGALMAPTEILAEQHYISISELLEPLSIKVGLLKGSLSKKAKETYQDEITKGNYDIIIGTHALIQEGVEFKNLGLAVIDEQHRFGVKQRSQLKQKGYNPDILVMTATPIPRTLALTVYGDLDLSVINEMPPGRQPIKTYWVTKKTEGKIYEFIKKQLDEGRQAYVVCPLIEESEKMDLLAATNLAETWQKDVFPENKIGLIHGKMKTTEKENIMNDFRNRNVDILVSTTVIEVGVNVPNATIMVIQDAERFGLAQLHQLRGRVGRGNHQSFCLLIANPKTDEGKARMNIMQSTNDGFIIAEEDLQIRGPGEFFGTKQAGLPEFKIANIIRDVKIMEIARTEAKYIVEKDCKLTSKDYKGLREALKEKFKDGHLNIEII